MSFQGSLNTQARAGHILAVELAVGQDEFNEVLKVTHWERKERLKMKKELDKLKEDFTKLKGMAHLAITALNLQNNRIPPQDIVDIFDSQIVEELLSKEEVPEENLVPVPVPGPSFDVPNTLWEILPSPSLSLRAFLSEPIILASSIPPLGMSPQLLQLLMEDSSVGVGAMGEELKEAIEHEAKVVAMVDSLVKSEEEPLTNNPDAIGELCEAWDLTMDTAPVEGDFKERYARGGFV